MVGVVNRQPEKANNKAKTTTTKLIIVDVVNMQPEVATQTVPTDDKNNEYNKHNCRCSQ